MNNQPTLYPFQDGLLAPPKIEDGGFDRSKHISNTVTQFPEQVEQELALFAYDILKESKDEYSTFGDLKKVEYTDNKQPILSEVKSLQQKRMCLLELQLKNLEKVKYLAENYQEKKESKEEEDGDEIDGKDESEEDGEYDEED